MKDQNKTSAQLLSELAELRQRVAELETAKVERETWQAKSEEALRESEEKYRILLDESSDPVFTFNPEGQYRYVNKAFADGVGKKREEITGKKIWDVFPKDEADKRYAAVKWVFENGETKVIEVRVPRPDGERYYITTVKPILNDQGKVISVICTSKEITERKRAEESLRLQSAALEAAANGIVITDPAGTVLWTNPAFTALTGYTAKEAIGQNPRILKSGLHAPAFYQTLWQTIQSGQVWHAEVMNRRKDGSLYVEEMTITPVRSTGGEITHFVAIKQDVTERKWTENKLQETKDQLEAILQGVADGINVSDAAGQLVYVNDAAAHAAGYPTARAMLQAGGPGRLYERFDILDESGRPFPIAQLPDRLALQEKQAQSATLCYRGKAIGEEKWSVVQATPILDENGQVRFVVAITHDITEHKLAAEALRGNEERLKFVLEGSQQGLWDWNIETGEVQRNERWAEMLGYTLQEIEHTVSQWTDLIHPDDRAAAQKSVQDHLEGRTPMHEIEYRMLTKYGPYKWILDRARIVKRDAQGRPLRMSGTHADITKRKQVEASLEKHALQLRTAAEVSRIASSILNPDELLPQVVELIHDRFNLYYVGLFLVDETGQRAVLRAGTGEAGRKMIAAGHILQVGGSSMIGWCIAHSQARIALDVGEEATRFSNPLLPQTRSEMALPLVSRGSILGAMTIQSDQPTAFSQEDITVLQTMADQLANAIENARLFEQAQREIADRKQAEESLARHNRAMAALYETSLEINSQPDVSTLPPPGSGRSLTSQAARICPRRCVRPVMAQRLFTCEGSLRWPKGFGRRR